jgi:hypothetical protein
MTEPLTKKSAATLVAVLFVAAIGAALLWLHASPARSLSLKIIRAEASGGVASNSGTHTKSITVQLRNQDISEDLPVGAEIHAPGSRLATCRTTAHAAGQTMGRTLNPRATAFGSVTNQSQSSAYRLHGAWFRG